MFTDEQCGKVVQYAVLPRDTMADVPDTPNVLIEEPLASSSVFVEGAHDMADPRLQYREKADEQRKG